MGIPGLWTMMKDYSTNTCLIEYSALEGVRNSNANVRGLRVGIDIGPWLFHATAPSHRHQSKNIALASIFKRCTTLFGSTTVIPIFVFDGPGRPDTKRGVHVQGTSHHLLDDTKALLDALGFAHHEAPGEAEAELAWMSANGMIDAVWTEDSDAFAFGATRVIRLQPSQDDDVSLKLTDISIYENFALSREQFVFIALLAGGDYSPGIPNCGIKKSCLLAETGIGDDLVRAASRLSVHEFTEYALSWHPRFLAVLREHSATRSLAKNLPSDFPSYNILRLYIMPRISQSLHILSWDTTPNMYELACFVVTHFSWGTDLAKILKRFDEVIFPGLAIRELLKVLLTRDNNLDVDISPLSVIVDKAKPRRDQVACHPSQVYLSLRITLSFLSDISRGAQAGTRHLVGTFPATARNTRVWVPSVLYDSALLEEIEEDIVIADTVESRVAKSDSSTAEDRGINKDEEREKRVDASGVTSISDDDEEAVEAVGKIPTIPTVIDLTSDSDDEQMPPVNAGVSEEVLDISSDEDEVVYVSGDVLVDVIDISDSE